MSEAIRSKLFLWVNTLTFSGLLALGGLVFVSMPKQSVSDDEKRSLAPLPQWDWQQVAGGHYFKAMDDYVADNFIMRYQLTQTAGQLRSMRGWALDEIEIYKGAPAAAAAPAQAPRAAQALITEAATQMPADTVAQTAADQRAGTPGTALAGPAPNAGAAAAAVALASTPAPEGQGGERKQAQSQGPAAADEAAQPYQNIESIIIYKSRAVQMVGASTAALQPMSRVINQYQKELGPAVKVYFMPIPVGSDFYLPPKFNKGAAVERRLISHMFDLLEPEIGKVRSYERLAERTGEYIYFYTDHHWTGLGAYYAYQAFAEKAQFAALPLNVLEKKTIKNFLGTLYHRTMSPTLKNRPDDVEYFKVPHTTKVRYFQSERSAGSPGVLYAEFARGPGAYGVFLGGDHPLVQISSDVRNGRKIVVIKDSYGNAFVPYLASHYEEVFVVDYRYFNGSIRALIGQHGIGEVLFAHNTYVMVAPYTAQRARSFLQAGATRPAPPTQ